MSGKPQDPDPRIAPLAAALANALTYNDHHPYDLDPIGSAAAILAALPPGWCEDDELLTDALMMVSTLRGQSEAAHDDAWVTMDNQQAEIARLNETLNSEIAECVRLRAVEEAAIDLIANTEVGAWPVSDNLRAALGSEKDVR